ncbi:MAG: hypothetical protein P8N23_02715 [Methylophilaceae bacterium]|nr:hypothetical protein [Methylophilaceae bacterium]MDG1453421.1 hypothetical protein [Methylophilaceae bacterium]
MIRTIILCLLSIGFVACSSDEKLAAVPTGEAVLILGDSLIYGKGAAKRETTLRY